MSSRTACAITDVWNAHRGKKSWGGAAASSFEAEPESMVVGDPDEKSIARCADRLCADTTYKHPHFLRCLGCNPAGRIGRWREFRLPGKSRDVAS